MSSLREKINQLTKNKKATRKWSRAVISLALVVALITTTVLINPAHATSDGDGATQTIGGETVSGNAEAAAASEGTAALADAEETAKEEAAAAGEQLLTYTGEDYAIEMTYGTDAGITDGSTLTAAEITDDVAKDAYLKEARSAIQADSDKKVEGRFFDLTIKDAWGQVYEPLAPVNVKITYTHKDPVADNRSDLQAVHITDAADKSAEITDPTMTDLTSTKVEVTNQTKDTTADTAEFTAESFSIYGVVYTVDFHNGDLVYSIEGESSVLLSTVLSALNVTDFTADQVEKAEFSNAELVKVEKMDAGTAVSGNAATTDDWLLTSLKPFTSEEKLTLTMKDGSVREMKVTDEVVNTARDLRKFLTDVRIDGATTDENGNYVVKPGKDVNVHLTFAEGSSLQFNNTSLWYPIPKGLSVLEGVEDKISVTIQDDGKTYIISDNYYKVVDGKIQFTWNTSDPNFSHLKSAANVQFALDFTASFDGTTNQIKFSDEITKEVVLDNSKGVTVNKTAGNVDLKTGEAEYTLAVTSTGDTKNIVVTDTFEGKAVSLVPGSVGVYTDKNTQVEGMTIPNGDSSGFSLTIPSMTDGQTYYVKYKGKVDFSKLTRNADGSYGIATDTTNKASVKPEEGDGDTGTHDFNHVIAAPTVSKSAVDQSDNPDGTKTVTWTINATSYNLSGTDGSLAGGKITDKIADDSTNIMKYSGTGLTVVVKDPLNNDAVLDTRIIPWSEVGVTDLTSATGWTYNVPNMGIDKDNTKLKYTITYTTDVDMQGKHGSVDVGNGTGTTDKNGNPGASSSSTGTIGPLENETPGVKKSVKSITTEKENGTEKKVVTWNVDITVPATGLSAATVTDIYPSASSSNGSRADTLSTDADAITYSGMLSGTPNGVTESADANTSDASKAVITFSYTKDGKIYQGLYGTGEKRKISVQIKTVCDQNWIEDASTLAYMQGHKNNAQLNAEGHIYQDTAEAYPGFPPQVKKYIWNNGEKDSSASKDQRQPNGTMNVDGMSLPYWVYRLDIKGIVAGSSITDTYDPRLVYVPLDPNNTDPAAMNGILYGGDQYNTMVGLAGDTYNPDQNYEDRWVDASVNGNTVTFNIQDQNIPKKFWNGQATTNYCLLYTLRVKDGAALESLQKEAANNKKDYYASLGNLAEYGDSKSSVDAEYKYEVLNKELLNEGEINATNNVARFKITVNPSAYDLDAGSDYITVTDTFSNTLSIDYNSIAVSPSEGATWNVSDNTATFKVPDETALTITYDAYINGTGSVTIHNTASVEGASESVDKNITIDTSGEGVGSTAIIRVKKHKYGDMTTSLPGAVFQLYKYKGESYQTKYTYTNGTAPELPTDIQNSDWVPVTTPKNPENGDRDGKGTAPNGDYYVTATTDKDGIATFKGDISKRGWIIWNDQLYALKEIKPPQGYTEDSSAEYWKFIVATDSIPHYDSYIYRNGDSMRIANYPQGGILIRKDVRGIDLTEDQKKAITFEIKDPSGKTMTLTYAQFVNGEYKITDGYQTGTYTITERAKAPENYSLKPSEETSWYDNSKDLQTSQGNVEPKEDGTKVTTTTINVTDKTKEYTASFVNKYLSASLRLVKVNENGTPLAGAVFTLEKDGQAYKTVTSVASEDGITFNGLQPGTYMLSETEAPEGYEKLCSPMTFTVNDNYELTWNGEVSSSGSVVYNYASKTVTVKNKPREEEKGEIEVQKKWEGDWTDTEKVASVQLKKVPVLSKPASIKITHAYGQSSTVYLEQTREDKNGVSLRTGDKVALKLISGNNWSGNGYENLTGAEKISYENKVLIIKITDPTVEMTINGANNPTYQVEDLGSLLVDNRTVDEILAQTENDGDPVTLDSTNNWYHKWTGLSTDYTYYVEEQGVNSQQVAVTYTYKGAALPAAGISQGLINVHNKKQNTSYVLPSTGGVGTSNTFALGIAMVSFALLALGIHLKKREFEEAKEQAKG